MAFEKQCRLSLFHYTETFVYSSVIALELAKGDRLLPSVNLRGPIDQKLHTYLGRSVHCTILVLICSQFILIFSVNLLTKQRTIRR